MSSAASPASSDGRRGRDVTKVGFVVVVFGCATERAADEEEDVEAIRKKTTSKFEAAERASKRSRIGS